MARAWTFGTWLQGAALAAAASVALVAMLVIVGESSHAALSAKAAQARCRPLPAGAGERAAERVVERFLRMAVVSARPSCDPAALTVPRLEHARYATRRPVEVVGWWQLAPRITNARGVPEYAGFMWLDAPDAAPAAFEFLLELHGGRWLVSEFSTAPGSAQIELANAPT